MLATGLLFTGTAVFAGDYATDSGAKFSRGLANTTTGWSEIAKNIANESCEHNALAGATYGTLKGTAHTLGSFVPSREYIHSTYVWDDTENETSYGVQ